MIEHGPDDALDAHAGLAEDALHGDATATRSIATTGDPEPELLADLDGERVGRARMTRARTRSIREQMVERVDQLDGRRVPERRLGRAGLRRARRRAALGGGRVLHAARRGRPVAAWREHMARLEARAAQLNERKLRRDPLPRARAPT